MGSTNYKLALKSSLDETSKLIAFVEEISDDYNINNNYFGNILVALSEAVENAIIHANKLNDTKKVSIEFSSSQAGLSFKVTDEGEGFNLDGIPDPTEAKNDEKKGRGVDLIKKLTDSVDYNNESHTLELIFKISSINKELSSKRASLLKQYEQENVENLINNN